MTRKPKRRGKTKPARKSQRKPIVLDMRGLLHKPQHRPSAASLHRVEMPKDGIARNYGQLVALLTQRRVELNYPHLVVDELAGLDSGYTGKLEQPQAEYGRSAVNMSFDLWIGALKVGLKLVPFDGTETEPLALETRRFRNRPHSRKFEQ